MRAALTRHWFLCALAVALIGGLMAGCQGRQSVVQTALQGAHPAIVTAVVLFLMSFSLDTSRFRDALRYPLPVIWGAIVNLGLTPFLAMPLAGLQSRSDFSLGLMIAAIAPCTLATASVFTRRARGNDAISLLVTLVTNLACVVVSPLWLAVILRSNAHIDLTGVTAQLVYCVLIPTLVGQGAQLTRWGSVISLRFRAVMNLASQWLVLLLVVVAAMRGGMILRDQPTGPAPVSLLILTFSCLGVHGASLWIGWMGAKALRASTETAIAVALSGSQKTLPIGILMATHPLVARDDAPFVTFPLLAFHAGQLIIDAVLADRWAERGPHGSTLATATATSP